LTSTYNESHEKIRDVIKTCINHDLISFSDYTNFRRRSVKRKSTPKVKVKSREAFQAQFLRAISVRSFPIMCLVFGLPIFRNDIYLKIMKSLDSTYHHVEKLKKRLRKLPEKSTAWSELKDQIDEIWTSRKPIFLTMIPRSTMKTTIFQAARAAYLYLRDTILHNQSPIVSLVHADIIKAEDNLELCMKFLDMDIVKALFLTELNTVQRTKKRVRFEDKSNVKRREPHFMTASVGGDLTGEHATYYLVDDWCSEENVSTVEKNKKNKAKFWKFMSLNDNSGKFRLEMVGTHYLDDTVYCDIINKNLGECHILGVSNRYSKSADDPMVYNFAEVPMYTPNAVEQLFESVPTNQYMSQYEMIPYKRSDAIVLTKEIPNYFNPFTSITTDREWLGMLIDPAVSEKNRKSRLVILIVFVSKDKRVFVVDGFSSVGTKPTEFMDRIFGFADIYAVEELIIESIAAQEYMTRHIEEEMVLRNKQKEVGDVYVDFSITRHRHFINKARHYKNFLEPLLARGILYINPKMEELIRQITGKSTLDDEVDCLSFLKELHIDFSDIKKSEKEHPKITQIKRLQNRSKFARVSKW